jgi:threonine/homoserine/homoserine lactone efflux protein
MAEMEGLSIVPFMLFCLIATVTPGPNNMINLAQGMRLGFRRALPFAMGTGLGVGSLLFAVTMGLGAATAVSPRVDLIMRAATGLYLLYLAWRIATSAPIGEGAPGVGLGFWSGIGFQWINPKTWASAMAMATTYLPPNPSRQGALLAAAIFCAIAWLTQPAWIGFGGALRRLLSDPGKARFINLSLAALLLASTLPFLLRHD